MDIMLEKAKVEAELDRTQTVLRAYQDWHVQLRRAWECNSCALITALLEEGPQFVFGTPAARVRVPAADLLANIPHGKSYL